MNSTLELIQAIANGEMVVVLDSEDRENEGDLIMAAQTITPEAVNFMITHARGLLCLPIAENLAQQLNWRPMVEENQSQFKTNFTVSVEAACLKTSGISAQDRATTIRTAASEQACAADFVSPGHIFPLIAQPGGVLTRAGHTEAVCDLVSLAGMRPIGVLIEILKSDGTMARLKDCEAFAQEHHLKIGTIEDLIHYRKYYQKAF